jgi:hypothetical protein
MPSTSTTLSVREQSCSRADASRGRAPNGVDRPRLVSAHVRSPRRRPSASRASYISAGVAQLVERQPSKLNVASSNLVSRSVFLQFGGFGAPTPKRSCLLASVSRSTGFGAPSPKRSCLSASVSMSMFPSFRVSGAAFRVVLEGVLSCFAHLAQLVEHVLGKDEVTSSILVVGSKRLRHAAAAFTVASSSAAVSNAALFSEGASARVSRGGGGVTTEPATHE